MCFSTITIDAYDTWLLPGKRCVFRCHIFAHIHHGACWWDSDLVVRGVVLKLGVHRMCSKREGSTLLPVWTGESAMSKQACLFGLNTHFHTQRTRHTIVCSWGAGCSENPCSSVLAVCKQLEEVCSDQEWSICRIRERKDGGEKGKQEGTREQRRHRRKYGSFRMKDVREKSEWGETPERRANERTGNWVMGKWRKAENELKV